MMVFMGGAWGAMIIGERRMTIISDVYKKYLNGDSLTDLEISEGMKAFRSAEGSLFLLGDAFSLARKECTKVYLALDGFKRARASK